MWINAMSRVAKRNGLTIPELLKQQREQNANKSCRSKRSVSRPRKKDPFEGLSTSELYFRRPMD